MALVLLGLSIWFGAVSGLVAPVAFVLIITRRFIKPEEATLRKEFGAEAESYMRTTRRWFY
jgi:protein-S-isoprenylcysteine O-methyltransferase Ste14